MYPYWSAAGGYRRGGASFAALVNALLGSGCLGRAVSLDEVESIGVDGYQRKIDTTLGLI